jgi:hypothetical protein
MPFDADGRSMSPSFKTPASSAGVFLWRVSGSGLGDREARADRQSRELIDRGAAGTPIRELLFVEMRGHMQPPFAGYRSDHRAGVKLAAIDAHCAAEAAADLESGLDDGVAGQRGPPSPSLTLAAITLSLAPLH